MRALVISAFALTLFLSAATVYFALNSDSLDGEPFAVIAIQPPKVALTKSPSPTKVVVKTPERETQSENQRTTNVSNTASPASSAGFDQSDSTETNNGPKLSPSSVVESTVEDSPAASEEPATQQATAAATTRTTETARPVSTTPEQVTDDPFFSSAEPGIGLGVGNLGPLEPASSEN